MPVSYKGRLLIGTMLQDSSKVTATGGVVDAVAPGMVDLGGTNEVVVEEGFDLGVLASGIVSGSSSSTSSSLLDPPKVP